LRGLRPARDPALNLVAPRFNRLASLVESNTVVVQRLPDGGEVNRFQIGDANGVRLEQLSHDGRFLAVRAPDDISIWDAETGKKLWNTNGTRRAFAFAPDRDAFVVEQFNHQATIHQLPTLELIHEVRAEAGTAPEQGQVWSGMALSPEGRSLVVAR